MLRNLLRTSTPHSLCGLVIGGLTCVLAASTVHGADAAPLTGVVKYEGPEVERHLIQMDADPKCAELHAGEKIYVGDVLVDEDGGLKNVFVYVKDAPAVEGDDLPPASLEQEGCLYHPHVQGVVAKQEINIVNADPTLHNVRALAKENRPFNLGQPAEGTRVKFFPKPEPHIKFKCDVHPWMTAYIFVMEHPYFDVTDSTGAYQIESLPPGDYTVVAWHERLGEQETRVTVGEDGKVEADFTFQGSE